MKTTTYTLRKNEIPAILLAAFPDYRGRKFRAEIATAVTFNDLHHSGGTRNVYKLVPLVDGATRASLDVGSPWNSPTEGRTLPVPAGFVVVEHSTFCGKDLGLRFHVHPDDVARLIPAPEVQA